VQAVVTILVMGLVVIMTLALYKPQDHISGRHVEESGCNGGGRTRKMRRFLHVESRVLRGTTWINLCIGHGPIEDVLINDVSN
jgi:hypothetical protein